MIDRAAIGAATFVAGATIWFFRRRAVLAGRAPGPETRLGAALAVLGIGTMASARPGLGWTAASIACSIVAIVLLLRVARDVARRR